MNTLIIKILKALPRAIKDPKRAIELFRRRVFPFGLTPKDSEAYRIASWSYGDLPRVNFKSISKDPKVNTLTLLNVFDRTDDLSIDILELTYLISLIKIYKAQNILEIGTWDGNTTLNIAANLDEQGKIVTVDLPPDSKGYFSLETPDMLKNLTDRHQLGIQYKKTKFESKIKQVYGDSAAIDWKTLGGPFDLIFIDGCHAFNYVKSDTENALSVLREGGTMVWHDYGMIKDVGLYLDQLAKKLNIVVLRGTRIALATSLSKKEIQESLKYSQNSIKE